MTETATLEPGTKANYTHTGGSGGVSVYSHINDEVFYGLSGFGGSHRVRVGETYPVVVHKVNKTTVHVSFLDSKGNPIAGRWTVPIESVMPTGTKVRLLGEVPEGGLSPLDPRLAWLWEDADRLSKQRGHCREYRDMCDVLGIPGPVKEYKIDREVSGLSMTIKVKARTKVEAEQAADKELAERGLI